MAKIITFGCRLNASESEKIKELSNELGISDNYTIINTCAVTSEAERQLRQEIRKLHNKNPNIKIILTGCASELSSDFYKNMEGVKGIIPNRLKLSRSEYSFYTDDKQYPNVKIIDNKVRGFLQIQNGCNHYCTYCVVRLTRGKSVSFSSDDIIYQAKEMLSKGYKELVLTGVNISSYGQDFIPKQSINDIIRLLLKVPELKRLRLSSLDPADIDNDLISLFVNEEELMPHIHESIQSGDNLILKRMRRRHSREMVIDINSRILEGRQNIIFGADMITGFPTETDEMFENSLNILEEANISLLHAFPYSKRPGTPAALMPQVLKGVSISRAKVLRKKSCEILNKKMNTYIGKTVHVLAEKKYIAKTDNFLVVNSVDEMTPGVEYNILCDSIKDNTIIGRINYGSVR